MRRAPGVGADLRWLAFPLAVVALALVLEPAGRRSPDAATDAASDVRLAADKKLGRTLASLGGYLGRIEPLASDGLSIDLLIDEQEWADLRRKELVESFRDTSHETLLRFNGGPQLRGAYHVRGQSSLRKAFDSGVPERLNFHIRLGRSLPFESELSLKRFYLQNLMFDPYGYEMRIAYSLLESVGLFHCHNQLVHLRINGQPLGIFLLVERPRDAILRTHRRVEGIYRRLSTEVLSFGQFYQRGQGESRVLLARLSRAIERLRGAALIEELEEVLDLDGYLRWLAFNSLFRNGDSFDEVFFYLAGGSGRLRVMGWDYDDIMEKPAHPREALKDPLLYASEGDLDRLIQAEPALYERFRRIYRELLMEALTPRSISTVARAVAGELDDLEIGLSGARDAVFRSRRSEAIEVLETALLSRREEILAALEQDPR